MGKSQYCVLLFCILMASTSTASIEDDYAAFMIQRNHMSREPSLSRHTRSVDIFVNTRTVIQAIVTNLQTASENAKATVQNFTEVIRLQTEEFNSKIVEDLQLLRQNIQNSISNAIAQGQSAAVGIYQCSTDQVGAAESLIKATAGNISECVQTSLTEAEVILADILTLADEAAKESQAVVASVQSCGTATFSNILTVGSCLMNALLDAQIQSTNIIGKITLLRVMGMKEDRKVVKRVDSLANSLIFFYTDWQITRLNITAASLGTNLQVCSARHIIEAGLGAAQIVSQIGQCSTSGFVYNTAT